MAVSAFALVPVCVSVVVVFESLFRVRMHAHTCARMRRCDMRRRHDVKGEEGMHAGVESAIQSQRTSMQRVHALHRARVATATACLAQPNLVCL